jgi:hypothetical protein
MGKNVSFTCFQKIDVKFEIKVNPKRIFFFEKFIFVKLLPFWVVFSAKNGLLSPQKAQNQSFSAFRIYFRTSLKL